MKNFIILYHGREGSSPIISMLSSHPEICVAGFEHMDKKNLKEFLGKDPEGFIDELLYEVFNSGTAPGSKEKKISSSQVVGFKWRIFGKQLTNRAIAANDCMVFLLYRSNVLRRALSYAYKLEHEQFKLLGKDKATKNQIINDIRSGVFMADPKFVHDNIESYVRNKNIIWRDYVDPLLKLDVKVLPVCYEDFCTMPLEFINSILGSIGVDAFEKLPDSRFSKVMREDIEVQCQNFNAIESDGKIKSVLAIYQEMIDKKFSTLIV